MYMYHKVFILATFILAIAPHAFADETCDLRSRARSPESGAADAKLPRQIEAILNEEWDYLDPEGDRMLAKMRAIPAIMQFSHSRQTFRHHLIGTFSTLHAWNQPRDVCRLGLFHTGYSGDLFHFYLFDAASDSGRSVLRDIVGDEAEGLIYLFGTVNRGSLAGLSGAMNRSHFMVPSYLQRDINHPVYHRIEGSVAVSSRTVAKLIVATMADYIDQMVLVNGWRDHHQVEVPQRLYPGGGKPEVALFWMSHMCRAVRSELEVIPPIFDSCRRVITLDDEIAARDLYWKVVSEEDNLSHAEQKECLTRAITLNPFIGEPHVMLSQIFYREGDYASAVSHSLKALGNMYQLGSAYDKRLDYTAWISYTRFFLLRSKRKLKALHWLPLRPDAPLGSQSYPLVNISDIIAELD